MSDPSLDPSDEDNYEDSDFHYEEPVDEPMWEPNEFYTDPMYGADTY